MNSKTTGPERSRALCVAHREMRDWTALTRRPGAGAREETPNHVFSAELGILHGRLVSHT